MRWFEVLESILPIVLPMPRVTPAKFLGFFFGADSYLVVGERRQG